VIDLAYDEARQLGNNYIGTEHLLLGLIREGEGLAGRVLAKLGVELERTRSEVQAMQDNDTNVPFRTRIAHEWAKLSEEQQNVLQVVGMPFGDLTPAMQNAVETFFKGELRSFQMDLTGAAVRVLVETREDGRHFIISIATTISAQFLLLKITPEEGG